MVFNSLFYTLLSVTLVTVTNAQRVAIAHLVSGNIVGDVTFTETDEGLHITGSITGLQAGNYGFHVHELGDVSTCDAAGAHYNPDGNTHGGPDHEIRHVGDLGNVVFVGNETAVATLDFVDSVISLRDRNSILGRALVLHEQEDDLGLGGDAASLATGNAGARVACAVIGIKAPADPWNAASSIHPSAALFGITFSIVYLFKQFM